MLFIAGASSASAFFIACNPSQQKCSSTSPHEARRMSAACELSNCNADSITSRAQNKIPTLKTTLNKHGHAPSWLSSPSWPSKQDVWGYLTQATNFWFGISFEMATASCTVFDIAQARCFHLAPL